MHFLLTHGHYSIFFIFLHILFRRTTAVIPLVFRVRERPDWVCFGDAQSLHSVWRSSIHTAEPLVLYLTSSAPRI
jgi:hypothetical protein